VITNDRGTDVVNGPDGVCELAAVVLAGGGARRLGGLDKPGIVLGGRTLAGAVAGAAIGAGARRVVLVGPDRPGLPGELAEAGLAGRAEIEFTSEQPPGAGPVPALRAGLALITERWLLLLAADLPFLTESVLLRLIAAADAGDGAVLADDQGRPQWLTSCWPSASLRAALADYRGDSLRGLLAPLAHVLVVAEPPAGRPPYWLDCDTPEDMTAAARWTAGTGYDPRRCPGSEPNAEERP
jgi:molybdenum cofactor guanylyltransferase